jgi:hypothetical protein
MEEINNEIGLAQMLREGSGGNGSDTAVAEKEQVAEQKESA